MIEEQKSMLNPPSKMNLNNDYSDISNECPNCAKYLREPVQLICMHSFCKQCVEKFMFEKKIECPMCRKRLKIKPKDKRLNKKRPSQLETALSSNR